MSEKEKFEFAESLLQSGNKAEASEKFLDILNSSDDVIMRVNCAIVLNSSMDVVKNCEQLIVVCNEGVALANRLQNKGSKGLLLASKGNHHLLAAFLNESKLSRMTLHPDWHSFALESEKLEYEEILQELEHNNNQAEESLGEALKICEQLSDYRYQVRIYDLCAQAYSVMCRNLCFHNFKKNKYYHFLVYHQLEYLALTKQDKKMYLNYLRKSFSLFEEAIRICERNKDDLQKAYVLHNYANQLIMVRGYKKSKLLLSKAKQIATANNDTVLQANIDRLIAEIKNKKNIRRKYQNQAGSYGY